MPEQLLRKVCSTCGSADVLCDAYASWDLRTQQWVLQNTFDKGAYCNACDGETRIEDEEVEDLDRGCDVGEKDGQRDR